MSSSLSAIVDRKNDWPVAVRDQNGTGSEFPRNLDEQHARLIQWFEEAERSTFDTRALSQRDRNYVDGNQWTNDELRALNARGQPTITINYTRRKLDLLCGLERKARTDPKAFPRTPTEEERADAATQALRYIADDNDFQTVRSHVFEEMLVEGFGGVEVQLEDDGKDGANVRLEQVPWDRIWYDPHSRFSDFSDARYKGIVIWMDRDELYDLYPDATDAIDAAFDSAFSAHDSTQYDDRPNNLVWTDSRRTRTRIVQCNWRDGDTWWKATYTRAGYLTKPTKSLLKDKTGGSACPLILQSGYIDLENNRYGMIRDLISLQDEINKRHSKALHLLSVHQVIAEKGAVPDVDKARREAAKPDGYIEIMPGMKFEINPGGDLANGQFQLLQHATQEMQLSGPNAAMSGTDPRELSGRAILAQQAGGAVQNEPLADSLRMWARRVYEMCWMAAREYWTAGKWVRVTDDLQNTRWVGINRPVTLQDEIAKELEKYPAEQRPAQLQQIVQRMQIQPGDPRLQQVIRIENDITDLDVDITVAEGQDVPTMQAENFQTLVQLASMQPGLIPGEVLIAASSLRNKDDLLTMMKQHMAQQQQGQAQAAQVAQQGAQAKINETQSKAAANYALAGERQHNVVKGTHDMYSDFAAPPYGQPNVADNAPGAAPQQQPPDPNQDPALVAQRHVMDMAAQQANIQKTHAQTATDLAKTAHANMKARADTLHTLVQANQLARTPVQAPGGPAQ